MRLGLAKEGSLLRLALDAREELSYYSGCLELVSPTNQDLRLAVGPGSPSGNLRFLADPVSYASLSVSPVVDIDSSFSSRRAALGLDAGPFSFFALGEGEGPVAFSSRSSPSRSLGAGSGGCSLRLEAFGIKAELIGAASFPENRTPNEGWRPDPASSPALGASEGGSPLFDAALVLRREAGNSSALAAAAYSWGRLAGEAAAFRLESREASGPLELALRASFADPRFRCLFGERTKKLLGASADARLELVGPSCLSVSLAAEAEGQGLRYAPLWGKEGSAALSFPLVLDSGRFLETSFATRNSAEGESEGSWACAIKRRIRNDRSSESVSLSSKLRWAAELEGLDLAFASELKGREALPSFGLELSLELFDKGLPSSPVVATGGANVELPFGREGSILLEASLPVAGIELAPRIEGETPKALEFSLRYKARIAVE
jgi:hypothetical protein